MLVRTYFTYVFSPYAVYALLLFMSMCGPIGWLRCDAMRYAMTNVTYIYYNI